MMLLNTHPFGDNSCELNGSWQGGSFRWAAFAFVFLWGGEVVGCVISFNHEWDNIPTTIRVIEGFFYLTGVENP